MADTRKDRRAPVSLKVRFKSATVDEFVEQYAMDISRGGIFIKSKSPMPIGTLLKFEFQLKDESRLIHGVGRVVWKRDGGEEDKPPGMGIKFIKMDPQSRSLVEQIVSQRGDSPGEFEQGRKKVKSVKKTQAFFPAPLPQDQLPAPEDSTQVRHASEFLAEALSAGDEDAAKEAAQDAERARKRGEEIAREREEAARREKEAAAKAEADEKEAPKAEKKAEAAAASAAPAKKEEPKAEKKAAEAKAGADEADAKKADEKKADAKKAGADEAAAKKADEKKAAEKKAAEDKAAEAEAERKKAEAERKKAEATAKRRDREAAARKDEPKKAAAAPAKEPEEPRSMMVPILIGVAAVVGIGLFIYSQQNPAGTTDDVGTISEADETPDTSVAEPDAAAADGEMAAIPEDAPRVEVRVATSPPGASVEVAGEAQEGETPFAIRLPIGHEVEVVVSKDGFVSSRQMVTATEDQGPLTVQLEPMPWVVAVSVTPSDARVVSAGATPNDEGEIVLRNEPRGPVSVTASSSGFESDTQTVLRNAFTQDGERMVARVSFSLEEREHGARPTMTSVMAMTTTTMTTPDEGGEPEVTAMTTMETTMEAATMEAATMEAEPTMEATMETTMESSGGVPDNPF